ncbi:type II toxin-antitoxin system antitoxin SocA domain-containing protein [Curtobacterium sp. PhB136]|uniref:Panacea domain-containing protein n=1 Tax=Curtobacterium sp. PhB136 TaxID=2485181 RepID=UPI001043CDB6|nr:type II toxin-antitoxin system antitoxin SocA domain-containing protein [Curtobacterium sp. PhB136]TCK65777.1 putative phage-associated protein [Curtobacterium sp. PhB136]
MHTALDVAKWFLAWADAEDAELSNLKLQKLLYYAQGQHLGRTGEPLFSDEIEAWGHGPVVPAVYRAFKAFGAAPIEPEGVLRSFDWSNYSDVQQHLANVWLTYGVYSAWALRDKTHREAPWVEAFNADERNAVIGQDALRSFFAAA